MAIKSTTKYNISNLIIILNSLSEMKSFIHILTNQSKDNNCRNYIDNLKSV